MLFVCYSKCSTCKSAQKILDEKSLDYRIQDVKIDKPSYEDIKEWHTKSGEDIKKFFNTSGLVYKSLGLKDKLEDMSLEEKYKILSSDGMLVKRPLLITQNKVIIGFKKDEYSLL